MKRLTPTKIMTEDEISSSLLSLYTDDKNYIITCRTSDLDTSVLHEIDTQDFETAKNIALNIYKNQMYGAKIALALRYKFNLEWQATYVIGVTDWVEC